MTLRPIALMLVPFILAGAGAALAGERDPARDYRRYCAECHGAAGEGGGAVADIAMSPVPALDDLAARHGGRFPRARVIDAIAGDAAVQAHGLTGMPGWHETFRSDGGALGGPWPLEVAVERRIEALADYIAGLQR